MIFMQSFPFARFGNNLFELAFLHSTAKKHGTEYQIPMGWKYSQYFEHKFPEVSYLPKADQSIKEPGYQYPTNYFDQFDFKNKNIDVLGYFQNEKFFDESEVKQLFKFKQEYVDQVREKYKHILEKPTIAVGIRRTDYVTSGQYFVLPPLYYVLALQKFDYKNCNIVFITDDPMYAWFHYKCLPNAFFPKFESDIEQFVFGTLITEGWIAANSTFHWWAGYLSNCKRVIQPAHLFAGKLYEQYGNQNFYIENERFEIFDHEDKRIDLRDVTITIPVAFDHKDRMDNLELTICLIQKNFDTNIIICEQGGNHFEKFSQWCKYMKFEGDTFHRTKMLNDMAKEATTEIVVNYDADVNLAPMQFLQAVELLRTKEADFVYPYEYLFVRVPKNKHKQIFPHYDLAAFAPITTGMDTKTRPSVGGCVLFNRRKFLEQGGENENFVSFCPEDVERYERFTRLGLRCKRVRGHLYHLDHHIGVNSSTANPHYEKGQKELEKVRQMTNDQLREYIISWPWYAGYTDDYRLEISPTAEQSSREVFKVLREWGVYNGGSVIDIGGGAGAWGTDIEDYTLVDFNVPKDLLKTNNYINHDLREPLKLPRKYDLALCLEVAEHLPEESANTLIQTLTEASDIILFSAAIPNQGGLNHFNEQWQSYWVEKFETRGFGVYYGKYLREELYDNDKVDLWYRNNLMLIQRGVKNRIYQPDFVHPKYYYQITQHLKG